MQGREDGSWDEYVSKYSVEYRMGTDYPFVYVTKADGENVVRWSSYLQYMKDGRKILLQRLCSP